METDEPARYIFEARTNMTDEQDKKAPEAEDEDKHGFLDTARETVAKAVGIGVELGSVLGGQGGDIVGAERAVAEAETEELLDRIDDDEG
jgi:hypothetical protein